MENKKVKLFESIKKVGLQDFIMEQKSPANNVINDLIGSDGLVSELAKDGRIEDSEWLKGQINDFRDKYSIYIR